MVIGTMIDQIKDLPVIRVWNVVALTKENLAKIAIAIAASFCSVILKSVLRGGGDGEMYY
jgi:hypothetical protein